jgi:hypothetical protein
VGPVSEDAVRVKNFYKGSGVAVDLLDDDKFEEQFEALARKLPKERPTEIGMAEKIGLRARMDLLMLEMLPDAMDLHEMMKVSQLAYDAVIKLWKEWLEKGHLE